MHTIGAIGTTYSFTPLAPYEVSSTPFNLGTIKQTYTPVRSAPRWQGWGDIQLPPRVPSVELVATIWSGEVPNFHVLLESVRPAPGGRADLGRRLCMVTGYDVDGAMGSQQ